MMGTVLLTDAQLRKTLSAARSLGSRGVRTLVAEKTRFSPAAFSRYCGKSLTYPDPVKAPAAFYQWLTATLRANPGSVLFPMDDGIMDLVMSHREELDKLANLPLPPPDSYRIAADKGETAKLAMAAGVACPRTFFPEGPEDLAEAARGLGFPLVVKPRRSSGSRGIRVVKNEAELERVYRQIDAGFPLPLLQEYIPQGVRYDVCLLYNKESIPKYGFVQKEIRHFPLGMGPSTVQESVEAPHLIDQAIRLLRAVPWYGIAEVEFMVDPRDGVAKLMEINPRFWNSLHLAYLSGVDFAWGLYRLAMEGDVEEIREYRTGVMCRWLLPGDLLHFAANPDRFSMNPQLWHGKRHGVHDDIWSWSDPGPALGFVLSCLRYGFDPAMWKWVFKR
jgi:predicted ATP-grasp superfamily ATP-dependent carboligase